MAAKILRDLKLRLHIRVRVVCVARRTSHPVQEPARHASTKKDDAPRDQLQTMAAAARERSERAHKSVPACMLHQLTQSRLLAARGIIKDDSEARDACTAESA